MQKPALTIGARSCFELASVYLQRFAKFRKGSLRQEVLIPANLGENQLYEVFDFFATGAQRLTGHFDMPWRRVCKSNAAV